MESHYYYVLDRDGKYHQVDGVPVSIEGFEDLDLFAHISLADDQKINISEGRTGCRIATGKDVDEASVAALEELIHHSPEEILKRREALIKEYGISPHYTGAGAPASTAAPAPPPDVSQAENHESFAPATAIEVPKGFTGPSSTP